MTTGGTAIATPPVETARAVAVPRPSGLARFLGHALTLRMLSALLLFGAWEYGGRVPISPAFPSFLETMGALGAMLADGSLPRAFAITLEPLLLGLAISITLGVGLGVWMGLSRGAEWLGAPVFIIAQTAPLAALIPILTFAYGIGLTSKVITVCILAMPPIVLNALNAVRHANKSLVEMGRAYLGNQAQIIWKIILPSAAPVIFAGLRLGCAGGFIGVILAELLITPTGIGDIITFSQSIADYPSMYAAIFSIILFSVVFIEVLERVEVGVFRPERRAA